jgi:hypothetical protein
LRSAFRPRVWAWGLVALGAAAALSSAAAAGAVWLEPVGPCLAFALVAARYALVIRSAGEARRLGLLRRAVDRDPANPERHFALAEAALSRGIRDEAVAAFRTGVGLHPELDLARPGGVVRGIIAMPGTSPARRLVLSRLLTLSIVERWGEEDGAGQLPHADCGFPIDGSSTRQSKTGNRQPQEAPEGASPARLSEMAASLSVEIQGLEELRANLGGFLSGEDRMLEQAVVSREIERLRSRLRTLEDAADAGD